MSKIEFIPTDLEKKLILNSYKIRDAVPSEAMILTELAARSKAHWPYDKQYLLAIYSSIEPS